MKIIGLLTTLTLIFTITYFTGRKQEVYNEGWAKGYNCCLIDVQKFVVDERMPADTFVNRGYELLNKINETR